jgi:protein phosphatase-4 regulatory subunit 3
MEDSTFNILNSCIIFNQIDLINSFQTDETFIRQIVAIYASPALVLSLIEGATPGQTNEALEESGALRHLRTDVLGLIQQLCVMAKNVQLQARLLLFRFLVDRGVIHAVQWALTQKQPAVIGTATEVLTMLLEHDINGIRTHIMRQADLKPETSLVRILSAALASPVDLALKNQLSDCTRLLLETYPPEAPETGIKAMIRQREDPIIEKFLEFIYNKGCVRTLFKPFTDLPEVSTLSGVSIRPLN